MTEQEKRKKLEMLPWQALFEFAIMKEISEDQIKGKDKNTIISQLLSAVKIEDAEIETMVNDYIYGERISFTLWNFEKKLVSEQYDAILRLEGTTEPFLDVTGFRALTILSVKTCTDRIEILYVYSKEYVFVNEDGKNASVWEQHRGCLWIGLDTPYLACISKHDKMTKCIVDHIIRATRVPIVQVKPPKSAIERCINQVARSRIVLQGPNGEKTIVSRSDGLTEAQQEEVKRIQGERFDTSGSFIAEIGDDTQATIKYNVNKGSIGIYKHLSASVLFAWSQSAIQIILEEIDKLKGRPAKEIFKELGLDIKWAYLYTEAEKTAAEWFLTKAISCLGSTESSVFDIPNHVKSLLTNPQLFTIVPKIYCEQCESHETPYCVECGRTLAYTKNGQLQCTCGAPPQIQCFEGHRTCHVDNWYIPTNKMYTMIRQNISVAFKQETTDVVMCIMGGTLHIAQPCTIQTNGVEVSFNEIECFSHINSPAKSNTREFVARLGEKCNNTCSVKKINSCITDCSMACLPKIFYSILPGFRLQPHNGFEYGDISAQVKVGVHYYEMKGIIKKNTVNTGRKSKPIDELLDTKLLSTSTAGEEIIRQFVEQGINDNRVDLIAVVAPQYFDNSFKGTLRFLAKLGGKKIVFIELDELASIVEVNKTIDIS